MAWSRPDFRWGRTRQEIVDISYLLLIVKMQWRWCYGFLFTRIRAKWPLYRICHIWHTCALEKRAKIIRTITKYLAHKYGKDFLIELDCSKFETMRFLMNPLKTSLSQQCVHFMNLSRLFFSFGRKKSEGKHSSAIVHIVQLFWRVGRT